MILSKFIVSLFLILVGCTNNKSNNDDSILNSMVLIPSGQFIMGGKSADAYRNEFPRHEVKVSSFYMDKTEVTNAEFSNDKNNLLKIISSSSHFVVCLGSGEYGKGRYLISMELIKRGLKPLPVISEHSIIDSTAEVGWGLQAMPGSLLHSYSKLGNACILNSNSTIDHDCIGLSSLEPFLAVAQNLTILLS